MHTKRSIVRSKDAMIWIIWAFVSIDHTCATLLQSCACVCVPLLLAFVCACECVCRIVPARPTALHKSVNVCAEFTVSIVASVYSKASFFRVAHFWHFQKANRARKYPAVLPRWVQEANHFKRTRVQRHKSRARLCYASAGATLRRVELQERKRFRSRKMSTGSVCSAWVSERE